MYFCLCHPNYINKNQSETNYDSLGTEKIDSTPHEADANLAQHGAGSDSIDGGTEAHTKPSADLKVDAMKSSVLGEKEDDHAEKNCENKDNIN